MVSVIVPVYNVEACLEDCIQSLVNQTYQDLEILLIDDGSTDQSGEICLAWQERDSRILYVRQHNQGQGPARNLGVRLATGQGLCFVDADDWLSTDCIERLWTALTEADAQLVDCDFELVWPEGLRRRERRPLTPGTWNRGDAPRSLIPYLLSGLCGAVYRRDFWDSLGIQQADCVNEDLPAGVTVLASVERLSYQPFVGYFYRQRPSSTTHTPQSEEMMVRILQSYRDCQVRHQLNDRLHTGIYNAYAYAIAAQYRISAEARVPVIENQSQRDRLRNCFYQLFPVYDRLEAQPSGMFGSYNLRQGVLRVLYFPDDLRHHHTFGGILAAMNTAPVTLSRNTHPNGYREAAIARELFGWSLTADKTLEGCQYLYIDLLEERYGTYQRDDGLCLTASEALLDCQPDLTSWRYLPAESEELFLLWQDACRRFANWIRERFPASRIVLVRNLLMTHLGLYHPNTPFPNMQEIEAQNRVLERKYDLLEAMLPGIQVVVPSRDHAFCQEGFAFGEAPWHGNPIHYIELAQHIVHTVGKEHYERKHSI